MITNSIKKEIINEWSEDFRHLSVYTQNKLYRVLGPFVIGLELSKLPWSEEFRPTFTCYPLWKSDVKKCLEESIFLEEIDNKKGLQLNIPYMKHSLFFKEAVECTKRQVSILEYQDISLKQLFEVFDKQFFQILIKNSPVGQAKLLKGKFCGALYVNDTKAIKKVLEELNKLSKSWSPDLFEWKYGKLDAWLQSLHDVITHRDEFFKQIEINKQDKKITKLQSSELTP